MPYGASIFSMRGGEFVAGGWEDVRLPKTMRDALQKIQGQWGDPKNFVRPIFIAQIPDNKEREVGWYI